MDNENFMNQFHSPEEYIRHEICANRGTQNVIDKSDLASLVRSFGIEVNEKKMSKEDLYLLLCEKISVEEIAEKCLHLGVNSYFFQQKFGITHNEVKRMARLGFLKVTGSKCFRMYGKYRHADVYSVFDYFWLTKDEVDVWLESHPKGTRMKKEDYMEVR